MPKRFEHRGGCYFASATEKVEDGEFSPIVLRNLGERAKFICRVLFLGNCRTYKYRTGHRNVEFPACK